MSKLIDACLRTNNVVFDANYLTGGIADRSPYKAAATVAAPVTWCNTKLGYGIRCTGAGKLTYASNAALSLAGSSATWVLQGGVFQKQITAARLLSKRDASGTDWDIKLNSATELVLFDGTNVSVMTGNIIGKRCIAITLVSGAKPKLYLDGTYVSEGSLTCTIPTNATPPPFVVSSFYSVAYVFEEVINRITILNRALPAQDIAQLYTELMSERYPLRAYSFGSRISAPQDPPGCPSLLKTDFTTRLPDGRLADLSGNGWHGTVKPGFAAGPGMFGNALMANSASRTYVDFGDVTPINGASKLTVLWYGNRGPSNAVESIYSKASAANARISAYFTTTTMLSSLGNGEYFSANDANVSTPLFRADVYDGTAVLASRGQIYADNSKLATTVSAGCPATLPNNSGINLEVGRLGFSINNQPCQQYDFFAVYPQALTDSQVEYVRRQIARRSTFSLDMQRVPVSLANMVGPCEVPNTPFRLQSGGTWKVSEDAAGKRWFESVAGNSKSIYMPSTQAYGTYVFDVLHTSAGEWIVPIINSADINDAARNGYGLLLNGTGISFYKMDPAAGSSVLFGATGSIAVGTAYSIAFPRNSSGQFTVCIKGGLYGKWTPIVATSGTNPVTNAVYTTTKFVVLAALTAANAGKFSNPRRFECPLSLDQLQELCT